MIRTWLDNTALADWQRCPMRYHYRHVLHLDTEFVGPALSCGKLWHESLVVYDTTGYDVAVLYMQEHYDIDVQQVDEVVNGKKLKEDKRSRHILLLTLALYHERYSGDKQLKVEQHEQIIEAEIVPGVNWLAKIDGKGIWNGQKVIVERKTASTLNALWWDALSVSPQIVGQQWLARKLWDEPCAGVLVDAVQIGKTRHDMMRELLIALPHQIDQFEEDVKRAIPMLEIDMGHCNHACTKWNKKCKYWNLCHFGMKPEDCDFVVKEWNPWKV